MGKRKEMASETEVETEDNTAPEGSVGLENQETAFGTRDETGDNTAAEGSVSLEQRESHTAAMVVDGMRGLDPALQIAFYAAANTLAHLDPTVQSLDWLSPGYTWDSADRAEAVAMMATFVRANPTAPPEALWRYAHGRGFHGADVHGFHGAPPTSTLPYRIFALVLPATDAMLAEDQAARLAAIAKTIAKTVPPVAGPADVRGTILEKHGSITDRTRP